MPYLWPLFDKSVSVRTADQLVTVTVVPSDSHVPEQDVFHSIIRKIRLDEHILDTHVGKRTLGYGSALKVHIPHAPARCLQAAHADVSLHLNTSETAIYESIAAYLRALPISVIYQIHYPTVCKNIVMAG